MASGILSPSVSHYGDFTGSDRTCDVVWFLVLVLCFSCCQLLDLEKVAEMGDDFDWGGVWEAPWSQVDVDVDLDVDPPLVQMLVKPIVSFLLHLSGLSSWSGRHICINGFGRGMCRRNVEEATMLCRALRWQ